VKLQEMLRNELLRLEKRGAKAIRVLGFKCPEDAIAGAAEEARFFRDTVGSTTRKRGYERVELMADYPDGALWYPSAIAARLRCLEVVEMWIKPFPMLNELNCGDTHEMDGWGWIDRAIAALKDDLHRAGPSPDPKAFFEWSDGGLAGEFYRMFGLDEVERAAA
jgi:hypothetical protein